MGHDSSICNTSHPFVTLFMYLCHEQGPATMPGLVRQSGSAPFTHLALTPGLSPEVSSCLCQSLSRACPLSTLAALKTWC